MRRTKDFASTRLSSMSQYDAFRCCLCPGKAGPDSTNPFRTIVPDEQGAEIFPVTFGQRVAADHERLGLGDFDFDPGAAAPAAFVH